MMKRENNSICWRHQNFLKVALNPNCSTVALRKQSLAPEDFRVSNKLEIENSIESSQNHYLKMISYCTTAWKTVRALLN